MPEKWCVVNLGDAGRSPRMANHIEQIAAKGNTEVDYLTFIETERPHSLDKPNVRVYALNHSLLYLIRKLPLYFYFWLRLMVEAVTLEIVFLLKLRKKYDYILVQNPYSLPVLGLLIVYKLFCRECKVIIDIHNFGYSLIGAEGARRPADEETTEAKPDAEEALSVNVMLQTARKTVKAAKQFLSPVIRLAYQLVEIHFIRFAADEVLAVSKSMQEALQSSWGIPADRIKLLYDTANNSAFKKLSLEEKHQFLSMFKELNDAQGGSIVAAVDKGGVSDKKDRPLIVTVSTSWGSDDDFETLVEALKLYKALPGAKRRLELFFTGTGPEKVALAPVLKGLADAAVRVHIKWFESREYAKIVGCSDFTISVHNSSSGVDLPIKILDSFACEVPVIAFKYSATISELVSDSNGYLYENAGELCEILKQISEEKSPKKFSFNTSSWKAEWKKVFK